MHATERYTLFFGPGLLFSSMGDREAGKSIAKTLEMENLSLDISMSRFSRNLLQRFMGSGSEHGAARDQDEEEEVELNLGLSMGGRFGVDKSPNKLVRSSSVASCLPVVRDDNDVAAAPPAAYAALARTSSLPVETEEEWRKRKEVQTLRRMEAKRRRSEKQRNLRSEREGGGGGSGSLSVEEKKEIEMNLRAKLEREKSLTALKRSDSSLASQLGLSTWPPTADRGKGSYVGSGGGGSIESKGGSSSGLSDLESKNLQGSSGELSPGSIQSAAGSHDIGSSALKARETTSKAAASDPSRARGRENSMEDMPCVFTKGDGPNGRRVDGILYRYGKGEDVRIMCICHGSFHSPAEFVKHAGGTDTTNPLKHIVVNPNSSSLVFLASNPPVFEFLEKDIRGGSCCVTAFVHKGDLVVSNAGDCRAVMSQGGVAEALTVDHRPSLIEERERIESLSGYVDCCDGGEYIDLLLYPEQLEIAI